MSVQLPRWILTLPHNRREQATVRFLLKACALYASESGSLQDLSKKCGFHPHTLACVASRRKSISAEMARIIEREVGRDLFPRELLNPTVFGEDAPTL